MPLASGSNLRHYRIGAALGAGAMGEVYRATDTKLGRDVAIKVLSADVARDPQRLARFEREARALAALDHPGIVTVYSVEEADGLHFITMALVEGSTLGNVIPEGGLDARSFFGLSIALADALAAAHGKGVIHRDLKPGNIMVTGTDRVKILDFGLARFEDVATPSVSDETASRDLTREGIVVGTVPYMSPEQIEGKTVDHRTDIFSLGVLLYEMATGERPFRGDSGAALVSSILRDTPGLLAGLRPDLPQGLDPLLRRCLEKDPAERLPSARVLRDELESLRSGPAEPSSPPGRAEPVGKIGAIAVLPLANLSGDPAEEYFADGMTEALIIDLAKVGGLKVISRTSVMKFKGATRSLGEIARELGVDAVVVGSVLRAGDRVRISAQLIRAATDEHLWAERYDRGLEDVLGLQDEVARAIARQVDATLKGPDSGERPAPRKVDPEVYRLYLQGRHYWNLRTEQSLRAALHRFRQAIDRDPTWSPAWVGVADSLNMLSNYGIQPPGEIHPKALEAATKALELDDSSAEAHRVLAFIRWQYEFDWEGAIAEYERALELDPNSPLATYWYGVYLGVIGFFERSFEMLDRAAELDPLSLLVPSVQGWVRIFARRFDEAVPRLRRVLDIDPNFYIAQWYLGEALTELGEHDEAIANLERAMEMSGRISRMLGYLGHACGRAGREADARRMLAELEEREREQYVPPYFAALVHSGLGEDERALDRLEQAWEQRDTMLRDLKADPHWDRLHPHPRYRNLIEEMAFPEPPAG